MTDIKVLLLWILDTDKEWKPFVQNRVREILENVHPEEWKCWKCQSASCGELDLSGLV